MSIWQPIETAPKNEVLLLRWIFDEEDENSVLHAIGCWREDKGWIEGWTGEEIAPEHWMSIPEFEEKK